MPAYTFEFIRGHERPSNGVIAANDDEAYRLIGEKLKELGGQLVSGSIRSLEYRHLPDAPVATARSEQLQGWALAFPTRPPVVESPKSFSPEEREAAAAILAPR